MSKVRLVPLGGFLGAGKTTTMIRVAQELQARGERVAIVTNDQGEDLVDTQTSRSVAVPVAEVTGGCFCCRFEDLAAVVDGLVREGVATVVLAEAVGSCTDLQSTVVRPLRALRGDQVDVAPLAVVVDPDRYRSLRTDFGPDGTDATDLAHLYHHQLAEADVIALNKIDVLAPRERDDLVADLSSRFGGRPVLAYSAATGAGVDRLLSMWGTGVSEARRPFAVDYDRYASAEAELAWTNQVYEVTGPVVPDAWLDAFVGSLGTRLGQLDAVIGHVKVRVASARGCAKASLVSTGAQPRRDESQAAPTSRATALVNARVAVAPELLGTLIGQAVEVADRSCGSDSVRVRGDIFRPGYPKPVHRM